MKLESVWQCHVKDVGNSAFDLILVASGYELRAPHVAKMLQDVEAKRRLALGFSDRLVLAREDNDKIFRELGFEIEMAEGDDGHAVEVAIEAASEEGGNTVRMLCDITSMTRVWYASLIKALRARSCLGRRIELYFTYTPSGFTKPQTARPNTFMGAIDGFGGLAMPDRRTALILGLGYEAQRALGLFDYVEPAVAYAFLADPAIDPAFVSAAMRANDTLIQRLPDNHLVRYDFQNLFSTATKLASLCSGLVEDHRVIVAPLGPKPFTLLALLLAIRFPGIDVWRVSAGAEGNVYERPPLNGVVLGVGTEFVDA